MDTISEYNFKLAFLLVLLVDYEYCITQCFHCSFPVGFHATVIALEFLLHKQVTFCLLSRVHMIMHMHAGNTVLLLVSRYSVYLQVEVM